MNTNNTIKNVNIVLLGDKKVGKTSITKRYTDFIYCHL